MVYSLLRHKDPKVGSIAKTLAAQMQDVKATGPNEVQVTLAAANADFPVVLGTFHFLIIKDGTTDFTTAIGTGPYKCKEFTSSACSVGGMHENYWKPGKPIDQTFFGIQDETARVNALLSRDIQIAGGITPRATRQIKATEGYEVFETKSGNYTDLVMRLDAEPTKNPDFVQGMKYLLDREQMRTAIFQGYAVLGNDQPIDPTNRFYCPDLPQTAFDPDKRRYSLPEIGHWEHGGADRCVTCRVVLGRHGGADAGCGAEDRAQPGHQARAGRWVLVKLLDEGAAGLWQHQSAAQRRHTADAVFQVRCAMERERVEEPEVRPVAAGRPRRDGPDQTQADVLRHAAPDPR